MMLVVALVLQFIIRLCFPKYGIQCLGNIVYYGNGFYPYELLLLMVMVGAIEGAKNKKIYNIALCHECTRRYKWENKDDSQESLILRKNYIDLFMANSSQYSPLGFQLRDESAEQHGFNLSPCRAPEKLRLDDGIVNFLPSKQRKKGRKFQLN